MSTRTVLDAARVVDSAMRLADTEGLESVTMRAVAGDLGVTPMALYNHVDGREQLVDAMVEHVVAQIPTTDPAGAWNEALRARILAARATIDAHPWAWGAIETRASAGPAVLGYMDSLMGIMFSGGLSADVVHEAMHVLSTRMWGFTRDVLPTPQMPADPEEQARAFEAYAQYYPNIVRMATTASGAGTDCDSQAEFEVALDIIIDGLLRRHQG